MYGGVTSVDTPLQSEFSIGEAVEFGFTINTNSAEDMWGMNNSIDATRYSLEDRYFVFGTDYFGSASVIEKGYFFDEYTKYGLSKQGFNHEDHTIDAASVGGLAFSQIYIDIGFILDTFSGADDPTDIISPSEILDLTSSSLSGYQDSSMSFNGPDYEYVRFDITSITATAVSDVPEPPIYLLFCLGLLVLMTHLKYCTPYKKVENI